MGTIKYFKIDLIKIFYIVLQSSFKRNARGNDLLWTFLITRGGLTKIAFEDVGCQALVYRDLRC